VDEERLIVVGHSLGGYHALRLASGMCLIYVGECEVRVRGTCAICDANFLDFLLSCGLRQYVFVRKM